MSVSIGSTAYAGFKFHAAADWDGAGETIGAGDGFEVLMSDSPTPMMERAPNLASPGGAALQLPGTKAREWVEGAMKANAMFNGIQRPFAGWWSAESTSILDAGNAFKHAYTMATNPASIASLAWSESLRLHEIEALLVEEIGFEWKDGEPGIFSFTTNGRRELVDDSGANDLSTFEGALTLPTQPATRYLVLSAAQCTIRVNDNSGGALGSGDKVYPNAVSLTWKRSRKRSFTIEGAPLPNQPRAGAWMDCSGTLGFPEDDNTTDYPKVMLNTLKKMDITFVSDVALGGGYYWTWQFEFPAIELDPSGLAKLSTEDVLTYSWPFEARKAHANPTGMSASLWPSAYIYDSTDADHLTNGV